MDIKPFWQHTKDELAGSRLKRQLHRYYSGMLDVVISNEDTYDQDGRYRGKLVVGYYVVTLTTPEDFANRWVSQRTVIVRGKQRIVRHSALSQAFRLFSLRMKREKMWGDYFAVREWNSGGTCEHIHLIIKCPHIEYGTLCKHWTDSINKVGTTERRSVWAYADVCASKDGTLKGLANYLAKYLCKQRCDDKKDEAYLKRVGRGYWYSQNWIYYNWRAVTRLMYRIAVPAPISDYKRWLCGRSRDEIRLLLTQRVLEVRRYWASIPWSIGLSKDLRCLGIQYGGK